MSFGLGVTVRCVCLHLQMPVPVSCLSIRGNFARFVRHVIEGVLSFHPAMAAFVFD